MNLILFLMHVVVLLLLLVFECVQGQQQQQPGRCPVFTPNCENRAFHLNYRSPDGTCNNFHMPDWGASNTPLLRLLPPQYEDGNQIPLGYTNTLYNGFVKPNAREVSSDIVGSDIVGDDIRHSAILVHWGQIVAHDMTHAKETDTNCTTNRDDINLCYNIPAARNDRRIPHDQYIPVKRSQNCQAGGARQQVNSITAYLDASSSQKEFDELRGDGGKLRENPQQRSSNGLPYMPYEQITGVKPKMGCQRNKTRSDIPCFIAGDSRANEQQMLLNLHTIVFREHNRIVAQLHKINPEWSDETLFQETRKIVSAINQQITMYEWLPKILGPAAADAVSSQNNEYRPDVNPGVANEVSAAVMRFGHTLLPAELKRMDQSYRDLPSLRLRDAFFSPDIFIQLGDMDTLIRGAVASPVKDIRGESLVTSEVTEHLFPVNDNGNFAFDLPALNLQRAREHGISSYNNYREMCGLPRITTWQQFALESRDAKTADKIREKYGDPDNVDLWLGGMMERPLRGGKLGRTFSCILADQFKRFRQGDRHWFENPGAFGRLQVNAIRQYSLSKMLCNTMDYPGWMPRDAFVYYPLTIRQFERCENIPDLDLSLWRIESDGYTGKYDCSSDQCICVYQIGQWGVCDNGRQFRYDTLQTGRYPPCTEQRTVTRVCDSASGGNGVHVINDLDGRRFNARRDLHSVMTRRQQFFEQIRPTRSLRS